MRCQGTCPLDTLKLTNEQKVTVIEQAVGELGASIGIGVLTGKGATELLGNLKKAIRTVMKDEAFMTKLKSETGAIRIPGGKRVPAWRGSGPVSGVLGVNSNSKSIQAIKNYYPKEGGIEFVFDPQTNTFLVGKPPKGMFQGSAHQQLARSIGADESTVLGGTFSRGVNGEIYTTENSGHYGERWSKNPQLRQQFQDVMKGYGLPVIHEVWED